MRIALITPEFPGCGDSYGVGASTATIADALTQAGTEVVILVANHSGRFRVHGTERQRVGPDQGLACTRPRRVAAWLRRELAACRAEISECSNWAGLGAELHADVPLIVRLSTPVRMIAAHGILARLVRPIHARNEAKTVRRARRVIANSRAMATMGEQIYGRVADAVIPHAWTGPIAAPIVLGDDILFVGRLERRKGIDVLALAWPTVRAAFGSGHLHIVGADAEGFAAALGDMPGVSVHGRLATAELASLRQRCRIAVMPSRFESFGLVALEAWAAGQVLVACAAGGLAEVAQGAAWLVEPDDPEALAASLIAALVERVRGAELIAEGQRRLHERHAPAALARATIAIYREALMTADR